MKNQEKYGLMDLRYYPLGIDDPDTVLKFLPEGNYYEGLQNVSFDIDSIRKVNLDY